MRRRFQARPSSVSESLDLCNRRLMLDGNKFHSSGLPCLAALASAEALDLSGTAARVAEL
jgi:hypothetical protein